MTEIQHCTGNQFTFDLSRLPAERVEINRRFGLFVCAFILPFLIGIGAGIVWALQISEWVFLGFFCFMLIIPGLVFMWGLANLLTTVHTRITSETIEETRRNPWRETSWSEPLKKFKLQVKRTITTHKETRRQTETYYIRLSHADDLKSIELYSTESKEELQVQFRNYAQALDVGLDQKVRDYNTDEPIGDLQSFGLIS